MSEIQQCRLVIRAFWRAYSQVLSCPFNSRRVERHVFDDAEYLAINGEYGLLYGAPGWPYLKLHFTSELGFYLCSNGMDLEDFLKFQAVVKTELLVEGLSLHCMTS